MGRATSADAILTWCNRNVWELETIEGRCLRDGAKLQRSNGQSHLISFCIVSHVPNGVRGCKVGFVSIANIAPSGHP